MNKGFIKLGVLLAGFVVLAGVAGYFVSAINVFANGENHEEHKVTICHADPADTAENGYQQLSVDWRAIFHKKSGHIQHSADIIPPFGEFGGKNWDEEHQKIYRDGCIVPEKQVEECTLPLYEKDRNWDIVEAGASATVAYDYDGYSLSASGLEPNTDYTFIEYPEPQDTWPWPVVIIDQGTSDGSGNLALNGDYTLQAGEKYWVVLTSDLVDGKMSGWQPREYLFEGFLVPDNECLVVPEPEPEPTPTPERPLTPAGAPVCPDSVPLIVPANVHVVRNGSDATVNFFVPEGNTAHIYYKENSEGDWTHAARDIAVTGGYVSYTIHDLDPNLGYTFGVQAANSCAGGETVLAIVIDPPAQGRVFPFSFWEWLR